MSRRNPPARAALVFLLLLAAAWRLPAQGAEGGRRVRFRIEIAAGGMALGPADFNRAAEADESLQRLRYDHYLEHQRAGGQIESWSASSEGGRPRVQAGWLLEPRLRCEIGRSLALTAGVRTLQGGGQRSIHYEYVRELGGGDRYVEALAYSPYRLDVRAWWPSLGIQYRRPIGRRLSAWGSAAAGPLFAGVSYRSAWTYAWDMRGAGYSWPVFRDAGERIESGSGTGIGMEMGAGIERALGRRLAVFLAAAYSWQRVESLSGSGEETRAGRTTGWSGPWVTRGETIAAPWETLALRYPTCRPAPGAVDEPFRLDLSGWQLRVGLSWRL